MSNPKVDRALVFSGAANTTDNIEGNPSNKKVTYYDDFTCTTIDSTNDYVVTLDGTADTFAVSTTPGGGGWAKLSTGTTDNEVSFVGSALVFKITKNPVLEARINIDDVSGTVMYFGFSDANTEATPDATIDYADATLAAIATDAVGFVCDADKVSSLLYMGSIATGGSVAATTTGITWTDGQTKVLRVELNTSGDAKFYVDGVLKGIKKAAVTDVPLCFILNGGTRANDGANSIYVDYIKAWQDR